MSLIILCHFYLDDLSPLSQLIPALFSSNDSDTQHLSAYCISSIASLTHSIDTNFATRYINFGIDSIRGSSSTTSTAIGLYIIQEFALQLPTFFILNSDQIPNLLWNQIFSTNQKTSALASSVFETYINTLIKTHAYGLEATFHRYLNESLKLLNPKYAVGAMSVINSLVNGNGDCFIPDVPRIYDSIHPFLESKSEKVVSAAIKSLSILFSIGKPPVLINFSDEFCGSLFDAIKIKECVPAACEAFSFLAVAVPNIMMRKASSIMEECQPVIEARTIQNTKSVLSMLKTLIELDPSILNSIDPWFFVKSALFSSIFLEIFPMILKNTPSFWHDHSSTIYEKIIHALETPCEYSLSALRLIVAIDRIDQIQKDILSSLVQKYLFSKRDTLRAAACSALVKVHSEDTVQEKAFIYTQVIAIAASDTSISVRSSILSSLCDPIVLSQSALLKFLRCFANDQSPEVRSKAFYLLAQIHKYSPLSTDSVLRSSLISALYTLQCSPSMIEKANVAESLPTLIISSHSLFQVYSATLLPIFIYILTSHEKAENKSNLLVNIISSIEAILSLDADLVSPHLTQLLPALTKILESPEPKKLKVQALDLLGLFAKFRGPNLYGVAPSLLQTLLTIASESRSIPLRTKALELIGQCGAVDPSKISIERVSAPEINDPFPVILEVLSGSYSQPMKFKALETAISVLSSSQSIEDSVLDKVVPCAISQLRNSSEKERMKSIYLLKSLVLASRQKIVGKIPQIFECFYELWESPHVCSLLSIASEIVGFAQSDFAPYLTTFVYHVRRTLSRSVPSDPQLAEVCISVLTELCSMFCQITPIVIRQFASILVKDREKKVKVIKSIEELVKLYDPSVFARVLFSSTVTLLTENSSAEQFLRVLVGRINHLAPLFAHRSLSVLEPIPSAVAAFKKILENPIRKFGKEIKETIRPNFQIKKPNGELLKSLIGGKRLSPSHWLAWYYNFALSTIGSSPSPAISACRDLASLNRRVSLRLFPTAFVSCWEKFGSEEKKAVAKGFSDTLKNPEIPGSLLRTLIALCESMERRGFALPIEDTEFIVACERAQMLALGIYKAHQKDGDEYIKSLLRLSANAHLKINPIPLINCLNRKLTIKELSELSRWPELSQYIAQNLEKYEMFEDTKSYFNCARNCFRYDLILKQPNFLSQKAPIPFALASLWANDLKSAEKFSLQVDDSDVQGSVGRATYMIEQNRYSEAKIAIDRAFTILSDRFSLVFESPYSIAYLSIVYCQVLHELKEVAILKGKIDAEVWTQRLENCERSTLVWEILLVGRNILGLLDKKTKLEFLEISRTEKDYSAFNFFLSQMFPDYSGDMQVMNQYLRFLWESGKRTQSLEILQKLIDKRKQSPLPIGIVSLYIDYKSMTDDSIDSLKELMELLSPAMKVKSILQKYSSICKALFEKTKDHKYSVLAVDSLISLMNSSSEPSQIFSLLYLIFSLPNQKLASININNLSTDIFVIASAQILRRCGFNDQLSAFLRPLLERIIAFSPQSVIFSYLSKPIEGISIPQTIINECTKFRNMLLDASVTAFERWSEVTPSTVFQLLSKNPVSNFDINFSRVCSLSLDIIRASLQNGRDCTSACDNIRQQCTKFLHSCTQANLRDLTNSVSSFETGVPLPSFSSPVVKISETVLFEQAKTRPRRLEFVCSDGRTMSCLLKSHGQVEFDLRMLQFFSIVNRLLKKSLRICAYESVELSDSTSLIQLPKQFRFFESIVREERMSNFTDPNSEMKTLAVLTHSRIDSTMPIQRMEALLEVSSQLPCGDLRQSIWKESKTSDIWIEKFTRLPVSLAASSVVGALCGIGYRHPSNILLNSQTAEVAHIHFEGSFWSGRYHPCVADEIPFRLTRMLVDSLGTRGVEASFAPAFRDVYTAIEDGAESALAPFELYFSERLDSHVGSAGALERMRLSLRRDVPSEAARLIRLATDQYEMSRYPSLWRPLW